MTEEPPIPTRKAPNDLPDALPIPPPTLDDIYQLLEVWENVIFIKSLRAGNWDGTTRSEYMLWTTEDNQQFRVIWDSEENSYLISERTKPL
jgi:hypothetical protein